MGRRRRDPFLQGEKSVHSQCDCVNTLSSCSDAPAGTAHFFDMATNYDRNRNAGSEKRFNDEKFIMVIMKLRRMCEIQL